MSLVIFCASVRWRYGFNSILEVHIRRCSRMWSWSCIKQHRDIQKEYKMAYKTKLLSQSKSSLDTERHIQVKRVRVRFSPKKFINWFLSADADPLFIDIYRHIYRMFRLIFDTFYKFAAFSFFTVKNVLTNTFVAYLNYYGLFIN